MTKVILAEQGVFRTIQGEGHLIGVPMIFVRLAGCSVGCPQCDTDYKASEILTTDEVIRRIENLSIYDSDWIWLTGGEPTDQKLDKLIDALHMIGHKVALATAGIRKINYFIDWLSVSPHKPDFVQQFGQELKIVPGLNGFQFSDIEKIPTHAFEHKFIQPLWDADFEKCTQFVLNNPTWRLGIQSHKYWGIK